MEHRPSKLDRSPGYIRELDRAFDSLYSPFHSLGFIPCVILELFRLMKSPPHTLFHFTNRVPGPGRVEAGTGTEYLIGLSGVT